MSYPREEGQFILDTDASGFAIGAVLSQIKTDIETVLSRFVRVLNIQMPMACLDRTVEVKSVFMMGVDELEKNVAVGGGVSPISFYQL